MSRKPYIIGITGGSGSGKTTIIRAIEKTFSKKQICVISQDDYYRPREQQKIDKEGVRNFDRPKSIDKAAFIKDVNKLLNGKVVKRQEYTFNNEKANPKMLTFKPAPIILVEGLFVFHYKKMNELLDLKVFINAKENLKVIRRIKRDRVERNYPLSDVLYRYENHVLPAFEKYIAPYREDADLIINNNESCEAAIDVMLGFLKDKLA